MIQLALGLLVFVLTTVESKVSGKHLGIWLNARKYRRLSLRLRSAKWAMLFETIMCVWLFVGLENRWLMLLAIPGAGVGDWLSTGRKKRKPVTVSADDLARVEAARAQLEMEESA